MSKPMNDTDRRKLIATFEGVDPTLYERIKDDFGSPFHYDTDLNATMRAARKLPKLLYLWASADGGAEIRYGVTEVMKYSQWCKDDPARAAFLALSAHLENTKP